MNEVKGPRPDIKGGESLEELRNQLSAKIKKLEEELQESRALRDKIDLTIGDNTEDDSEPGISAIDSADLEEERQTQEKVPNRGVEEASRPPLKTEAELRASDWEIYEHPRFTVFASPDGKWLCFTPSLQAREMLNSGRLRCLWKPKWFGHDWEKISDDNYVAAYIQREKMGDFDPSNPYNVRDLIKYETIIPGKL